MVFIHLLKQQHHHYFLLQVIHHHIQPNILLITSQPCQPIITQKTIVNSYRQIIKILMGYFINFMPFVKLRKDSPSDYLLVLNWLDRYFDYNPNRNNHHLIHHNITLITHFIFFIFHQVQPSQNYSSYLQNLLVSPLSFRPSSLPLF